MQLSWKPRAYHLKGFLSDEECEHIKRIVSAAMSVGMRCASSPPERLHFGCTLAGAARGHEQEGQGAGRIVQSQQGKQGIRLRGALCCAALCCGRYRGTHFTVLALQVATAPSQQAC